MLDETDDIEIQPVCATYSDADQTAVRDVGMSATGESSCALSATKLSLKST